jgi:PhnB protein
MSHAIYLMFNGNCEEAMNFYKDNLGGNITAIQRYGEVPGSGTEAYKDKIMHAVMDLQGMHLMFSDAGEQRNVTFGDNFSLALDFKTDGDLRRAFDTLSTSGTVTMPVQDTFWGAVFGMCTDKFGINWMFNHDKKKD